MAAHAKEALLHMARHEGEAPAALLGELGVHQAPPHAAMHPEAAAMSDAVMSDAVCPGPLSHVDFPSTFPCTCQVWVYVCVVKAACVL